MDMLPFPDLNDYELKIMTNLEVLSKLQDGYQKVNTSGSVRRRMSAVDQEQALNDSIEHIEANIEAKEATFKDTFEQNE